MIQVVIFLPLIITYTQMGNECNICTEGVNNTPIGTQNFNVEEFFRSYYKVKENLRLSFNKKQIQCTLDEEKKINNFLQSKTFLKNVEPEQPLELLLQSQDKIIIHKRLRKTSELMLIVHFFKKNPEISRGKIKEESILVYEQGFYIGKIKDNLPEGKGSFYFTYHRLLNYSVKGRWQAGNIVDVSILIDGQKEIDIEVKGEGKGKLTFHSHKKNEPSMFYEGQIKTSFEKESCELSQLMTGVGKIHFSNKDTYQGHVLNGKMHSPNKIARYYSFDTRTTFEGYFIDGKRQGQGRIEIEMPKYQDPSQHEIYVVEVKYENGEMKWAGKVREFHAKKIWNGEQKSILIRRDKPVMTEI